MSKKMKGRNVNGRFVKVGCSKQRRPTKKSVIVDHKYSNLSVCDAHDCKVAGCSSQYHSIGEVPESARGDGWRDGRRLIELGAMLDSLQSCKACRFGPIPLTCFNILGEQQKGLDGYLYVVCQNSDCNVVNRVPYGKIHHVEPKGMPCFDANTKLGTAMIDSLGGPDMVNNLLSTLNIKPICPAILKPMGKGAGDTIENLAIDSAHQAAEEAFQMEMQDIRQHETDLSFESMEGPFVSELGECPLPGESPIR